MKCKIFKTQYKLIYIIIFMLIQTFLFNISTSFAIENNIVRNEQAIEDGIYIIKSAIDEKYVLDVNQASSDNTANIQLFEYVKENQQKFKIKHIGNGYYTITALHSGKMLDIAYAGKTPGTNVWQHEFNNTDAQKWLIKEVEKNNYNIISKSNGLYLDVDNGIAKNGSNIQVYTGNNSNAQKFKLEKVKENETVEGTQTIEDGIYAIRTALNEKYALDVSQASSANMANIQLFEYVKESQQKFKVKYNGDGYYTITALHSKKAVDVANGGKTSGTNVWQYEQNNSDPQKWVIRETEDGNYNIISKSNGLYLDVNDGIAKNGSNIQVYTENGSNAQKFKFEKVKENEIVEGTKTIEDGTYIIKTVLDEKYVLDVSQASSANMANIQLFEYVKENQQKFKVKYNGDGYYTITALHSKKAVDVANGGKTSGTNVWQYEQNNSDPQKWVIRETEDGNYNIISKSNGLYLDVNDGIAKNGSNIQVYTENGSTAQKFKFEEIKYNIDIDTSKYPGYKEKIELLMEKYPNWKFELLYTGLTFQEVIKGESAVHSRNLVPINYSGEWICPECGTKLYDSGWYCASEKAIAYYMDSRNFLDETNIFQFQDLNEYINGVCTLEGIQSQVNGTYLQGYANTIDTASKNKNVNSYYIVARMLQEQGRQGTVIGKGMDGGDGHTYYNPFNIGASGNGWDQIYANALATAKKYGWNTMQKAIEGGIEFCKKNWLENYKNTLYQNKFDIDVRNGTPLYQHQYMQNLMGAYSEARLMRSMYLNTDKLQSEFTFIIPIYENMGTENAPMPLNSISSSPINVQITADGGVNLRKSASTNSDIIRTIYKGEELLSVERNINGNWHKIITTDGEIGFMSGTYLKQIEDIKNSNYTAKVKTNDGNGCNVRVGPSTRLDKITTLPEGSNVTVVNKGTYNNIDGYNWYRVELDDGRQGFIPEKFLD